MMNLTPTKKSWWLRVQQPINKMVAEDFFGGGKKLPLAKWTASELGGTPSRQAGFSKMDAGGDLVEFQTIFPW